MASSPGPQPEYRSQSERITQRSQIIALLRRIEQSRLLIRIKIPGIERFFNSMLLKVNAERGFLLLDEINDDGAHQALLEAQRIRVFAQHQGVEINFACGVRSVRNRQGIRFYQAPLPERIDYLQRRADYRVHVGLDREIAVCFPISAGSIVGGQLCDLSMGGLGARLSPSRQLYKGLIVPDCRISLPQSPAPLHAELEVRFILPDKHTQIQRVGGRFVNLSSDDKRRLRKFVMQLEREMIRRKTRDDS